MLFNLTQNKWKQTEPSVSRFNTSDSQKLQNTSALDLNRTDAKSELSFLKWKYYLFLIFLLNGLILKQLFETINDRRADGVGSTAAPTTLKQQSIH